jgi:glycosyltransferase involved in cell wall biosynthesis
MSDIDVSVVMPCLKKLETISICIKKVPQALGEIRAVSKIVAGDNGSTDRSQNSFISLGRRIAPVATRTLCEHGDKNSRLVLHTITETPLLSSVIQLEAHT